MTINILMPALSPTMTEGNLARWLKKEGDQIKSGDVIAEIETDKATMEVEAADEGRLGKILVPEGSENIKVNSVIGVLLEEGEDESALANVKTNGDQQTAKPAPKAEAKAPKAAEEKKPEARAPGKDEPLPAKPAVSAPAPEPEFKGETVTLTVREALRDAMAEEMRRDDRVFLMGEEVAQYQGAYKVSQNLLEEFGERRVIDTPITEHGFTGVAVGAAFGGLRPILEFMTFNFALQAMDQILNSAAKTRYMSGGQMGCPIVMRGPNGAAARVAAQHSQDFASWYAHVPGLKVIAPYTAADAKGLLKSAIRDNNPVIFLENEILYGHSFEVPKDSEFTVPIGRARVARAGKDVTIVAYSICVDHALKAAEALAKDGIEAEVIDLRTLRPLDIDTIVASIKKTNRLVSVEEGWAPYGVGSELAALAMDHAFDWLDAPVVRVAAEDVPLPYAANLERLALPSPEKVIKAVKGIVTRG
jgi:pyruvate dehydrogenase E1 component beta subunit